MKINKLGDGCFDLVAFGWPERVTYFIVGPGGASLRVTSRRVGTHVERIRHDNYRRLRPSPIYQIERIQ